MLAALLYFVVVTVLTIALAPRPPTPRAASFTDFTLPTADQGRPIPVIFGTVNITGPNCVWYGDLYVGQIRQYTLFSSNVTGFQYFMGFHLVLGHGPFDSINKVYWDKKLTWQGNLNGTTIEPITSSGMMCMSWLNLFGGRTAGQGGIQGCFDVIFGGPTETQNSYLAEILGDTVPYFKGVTSVVWRGGNRPVTGSYTQDNYTISTVDNAGVGYIGTTPNIKAVEFECTRCLSGWNNPGGVWNPEQAVISQTTAITSPPTWAPTFEDEVFANSILASGSGLSPGWTELNFDYANDKNFLPGMTGYINIGNEWIYVYELVIDSQGFLTGVMYVDRGQFGTTPAAYAIGTPYYFYQTVNDPVSAMNPAHIIYQCLTDPRWGLGLPTNCIDVSSDANSFASAATTFYNEGTGLCMQWVNASTVEDFIKIVLDHCAANLVESVSGTSTSTLYQLIPIRGGYTTTSLPTYDETDIKELTEFSTQGWADEVNQVILVYTDPGTHADTAITGQDLANIDLQGKIVSQTVNYQGIRSHTMAANVLGREMTARCTPLVKVKFQINRDAWAMYAGGLFKLNWADRDVTGLIMRVTNVDLGKLEDNTITIEAVQDIYSLGLYDYMTASAVTGGGQTIQTQLTTAQLTVAMTPPPQSAPTVISATLSAPPTSPSDGDRYIVGADPTGAWAGEQGNMAIWDASDGVWQFIPIPTGVPIYDNATGQYITSGADGSIGSAGLGGSVSASQVSYDDSETQLGASTVQGAIQALAAQANSAISVIGYGNSLWYGKTFDGTFYQSTDGLTWVGESATGQESFKSLIYQGTHFYAISANEVGTSPTGNVFGSWTYSTPGPSTNWTGLAYFSAISEFVVWGGNNIYKSSNATSWSNALTSEPYNETVLADSPSFYCRLGEDATIGYDEIVQQNLWFENENGSVYGYNTTAGLINSGTALEFSGSSGLTYAEIRTSGSANTGSEFTTSTEAPTGPTCMLGGTAGTTDFTIEMWVSATSITNPAILFGQYLSYYWESGAQAAPTVLLKATVPSSGHSTISLTTGHFNTGTNSVVNGATVTSSSVVLFDGNPHHVVAQRSGTSRYRNKPAD